MIRRALAFLLVIAAASFAARAAAAQAAPKQKFSNWSTIATPAFLEAAETHAAALRDSTAEAGIWLVQDSHGRLVLSGIAKPFPTMISSEDINSVIPGARGYTPKEFGFALTPTAPGRPVFRVVYATVY